MPLLAIFTAPALHIDQYEALRKEIGWESQHPPGLMLHSAGFGQDGARVVDIWASEGELHRFFQDRVTPALEKLGIALPTMEQIPLHNLNAYPTLSSHQLR